MLTTRLDGFGDIETNIREDVLAISRRASIRNRTTIYLQSQVPDTRSSFSTSPTSESRSRGAQRIPTLKASPRSANCATVIRPSHNPCRRLTSSYESRRLPVGPGPGALHVELARESLTFFNERFGPASLHQLPRDRGGTLPGTDGSPKMSRSLGKHDQSL